MVYLCGNFPNGGTAVAEADDLTDPDHKLLSLLQENGVEILTQHALAGIGEGTVALKQLPGGETVSVDADIVVMALGNRPDKAYEDKLAAAFDKVIVVGDATKAGTMADATKAAYEKCFYI